MTFVKNLGLVAMVVGVTACVPAEPTTSVDPITAAVSGRTLVAGDSTLNVGADGTLTGVIADGSELSGSWTVRSGQWCRTLVTPARLAGTACQRAVVGDDGTITIDGVTGSTTWTIQ